MSDRDAKQLPIDPGRMALWMLRYPLRRKFALAVVLGTMLAGNAMRVLSPWPLKLIIDNVIEGKPLPRAAAAIVGVLPFAESREGLLGWCVAATVVLFVVGWAVGLAGAYAGILFGQRMIYDLAADLFGHLQRLSLRFHGSRSVGDLIRRVTSDTSCVATIVRDALLPLASALVMLVAMFLVMWKLSPQLAVLALAVVPLMMLAFRVYAKPMILKGYEQQVAEGQLYTIVERTLSAIPVVQAFGGEGRASAELRDGCAVALRTTIDTTKVQVAFKIAIGLATAIGTGAIIAVGSREVLAGELTVGSLLVFLAYLGSLYAPLNALMYTSSTINGAAGSAWRVIEIFQIDHEVADAPHARAVPRARGQVRLENVSFGYQPDRPALHDVTLTIEAGTTVAIVGSSGAGKSTLASLVPRFFDPQQGRVLLDGQDVRQLKLTGLREQVAVVLQEPFLFPLTVAQNVAYANPHATRQQIEEAARAAGADEFIRKLPNGYDTVIGERGATLSGGERQRVSIARALLKDAPVLILDEPTAALDAKTETGLLEALDVLMEDRTTLVIAHRLSTIRNADRIIVLDQGRVVEQGPPDVLLRRGGAYRRMMDLWRAQPTSQKGHDRAGALAAHPSPAPECA
jgi:ATP-binding cassette subfamily B protein/subfamily B ATP-binding cassette protein MsbA